MNEDLLRLKADLAIQLQAERLVGIPEEWFDAPPAAVPAVNLSVAKEEGSTETVKTDFVDPISEMGWEGLESAAKSCRACRLCEGRTNVVFGVGRRERPRIVFVGEGPGADEDRVGEPFVGRAGVLLTGAITKGMGLQREDVYICNVVKCRPPENRTPLPDEVQSCHPYLKRQIELLQPEVIITLGSPAQLALTGLKAGITKIRGQWLSYLGIPLMPTFHPAYILRNPEAKRPFWDDLQEVMKRLGMSLRDG